MRACTHCQSLHDDRLRFCPEDGAALSEPDPRLGSVFAGQFELLGIAGRGAMGTVYRAWQLGMDRPVAVKLLHDEYAGDPELVARFFREARAVARLAHPNIVTVHLAGTAADGAPFLVMELATGSLLEHELGRGSMPADRALRIVRQIASALADAHAAGIVHRDLKPANLVLEQRRRAADFVKILDFGIAKILEPSLRRPVESHWTRDGAVFGTPQYMSPEQAGGRPVDHRADLYSTGVILYRMLAGRLPFAGNGLSLLVAHMTEPVPPLPASVDPRLAELTMRLLEKEPDARVQSAEALADALDALLVDRSAATPWATGHLLAPVAADPPWTLPPARARGTGPGLPGAAHAADFDDDLDDDASELDDGTLHGFDSPASRRSGRTWVGVACALLLGLGMLGGDVRGAWSGEPATPRFAGGRPVAPPPETPAAIVDVPRRAIMVGEGGYSLRALIPETLSAGAPQQILLDAWDPSGQPLVADEIVVVVEDESGDERGLAAHPSATPGRFVLDVAFDAAGARVLRVLPPHAETSIRLHVDVGVDPSAPNS